jgi:hypothetical protein
VHRKHHNARPGHALADLARHFQAIEARHHQIDDEHVRLVLLDKSNRFEPITGFGHDLEVRLRLEKRAKAFADDAVIVSEQYAGLAHQSFHLYR